MKLVYTPEGAEPREWDFEPNRLMSPEAEAIETATGMNYNAAVAAVTDGNVRAVRAFLWVLLKRQIPTLQFKDLVIRVDEVDFQLTDDEARQALDLLQARKDDGEEFDPQTQALYEQLLEEAPPKPPAGDDEDATDGESGDAGKVTGASATSTAGSSPTS